MQERNEGGEGTWNKGRHLVTVVILCCWDKFQSSTRRTDRLQAISGNLSASKTSSGRSLSEQVQVFPLVLLREVLKALHNDPSIVAIITEWNVS